MPVSPTGRTVALLAAVALAALAVPVPLALAGVALVLAGFVVDAAWVRRPPVVERRVRR